MRLMAKPDMAFPNMETTLPRVMMVKSLVHREGVFSVDDILRSCQKKQKCGLSDGSP
jgi:Fe2+ or Zn2+ uptake regulation protein